MQLSGHSDDEGWQSIELGWSWWRMLQDRAVELLGADATPHSTSVPAWRGVFLPKQVDVGELSGIPGDEAPICIASLPSLVGELRALASAMGIGFTVASCEALAARYD